MVSRNHLDYLNGGSSWIDDGSSIECLYNGNIETEIKYWLKGEENEFYVM